MKYTKAMRRSDFYDRFANLGFTYAETETLRRAEMTLQRWGERECGDGSNWGLERDETTGKPYNVWHGDRKARRYPVPDLEKGALARVAKLMTAHPGLIAYHQSDPRGCALYILRESDVPAGADINAYYSRGFAICF